MNEENKAGVDGINLCRNADMLARFTVLNRRVADIGYLASRELVGPTEWAEAVSLARHAVDRVGESGGAATPDYVWGISGRDVADVLSRLVAELEALKASTGGKTMGTGVDAAVEYAKIMLKGMGVSHVN